MKEKFEKAGGTAKIPDLRALRHPNAEPVIAPVSGVVMWEVDFDDKSIAPAPGTVYKEGDLLCAINSEHGMEPVYALWPGKIVEATAEQGKRVAKGETIAFIEK
jgi:pyruvate carboxylase subunit B